MNKDVLFFWPQFWRLLLLVYSLECKWMGSIKGQLRYWAQRLPYWRQLLLLLRVLCTWRCSCHKRGWWQPCEKSMWKRLSSFAEQRGSSEQSGWCLCRIESPASGWPPTSQLPRWSQPAPGVLCLSKIFLWGVHSHNNNDSAYWKHRSPVDWSGWLGIGWWEIQPAKSRGLAGCRLCCSWRSCNVGVCIWPHSCHRTWQPEGKTLWPPGIWQRNTAWSSRQRWCPCSQLMPLLPAEMLNSSPGVKVSVKAISKKEKLQRKKYMGVCRWESSGVRVMIVRFPVMLNT